MRSSQVTCELLFTDSTSNFLQASPWKALEKAMGNFKKESSVEELLRRQIEKQEYFDDGGSGGNPPSGGGGGGGSSGGSEGEDPSGIMDEVVQVFLATVAFIFLVKLSLLFCLAIDYSKKPIFWF